MAIGDDAKSESYLLVPNQGEDGRVRFGAREINRTRDYIALLKKTIPLTKSAYRTKSGISSGTAAPNNNSGENGDIYLRIL